VIAKSDEFSEIVQVLQRHKTLVEENLKLEISSKEQDQRLEELKRRIEIYEKDSREKILSLNNETNQKNRKLEKILNKQSELRQGVQEVSAKRLNKI
jgi:K+/H+ antiporter YhaU regulatory subunit KhtT